MFASSSCTFRSPSKLFKMPKRKLTRSTLTSASPSSPRLDKFYRTTRDPKEMSPKSLRSRVLKAGSPSTRSPDIKKYFSQSPSSRASSAERPAKKRVVPKRRVNLNNVFESIIIEPITQDTEIGTTLKRRSPLEHLEDPATAAQPTKHQKTEDTRELPDPLPEDVPAESHISLVSNKTDFQTTDPSLPPPPCIKRNWKTFGVPIRGYKLFDPNSPRTSSKVGTMCQKLCFTSPSPPKTFNFVIKTET